jgi:biopolymer transport protein ExbD
MGMSVGGSKGAMSEPNIVPLIDVLLVLIIIFMVITPRTPYGLPTIVPQPPPPNQQQQPVDDRTVVVQVMSNGRELKINQDEATWDDLGPRLFDIFKGRADKIAFVKGDDNIDFSVVARAIDIMRGSGIDHVGLITAKIEAGQ